MGYQKSDMAVCRLCSCANNLIDIFHSTLINGEELRCNILLATGIHITPTDEVSKMICHRCCDITLKLNKYRDNAIANDKLLKERCGQQFLSPITDHHELFLTSSKIIRQAKSKSEGSIITLDSDSDSDDSLEIVNSSHEKNIVPSVLNTQYLHHKPTAQSRIDALFHSPFQEDTNFHGQIQPTKQFAKNTEEIIIDTNNVLVDDKNVTPSVTNVTNPSQSVNPNRKNSASTSVCKKISKVRYLHPSVRKLFKTFKNIVLPKTVFNCDVSPVISLDSSEVNAWYNKQLKQKLPTIVIKKVANSSNHTITLSPPKDTTITASNTNMVTSTGQYENIFSSSKSVLKPNINRISRISDCNSNVIDTENVVDYVQQKENDIPQIAPETFSLNQVSSLPAKNNVNQNQRIPLENRKLRKEMNKNASNRQRLRTKRHIMLLDDLDFDEVIPEKKKRVFGSKSTLRTFNKMDLPQIYPSDKNDQKNIFTSSLELKPIGQLEPSKVACLEPISSVEQAPSIDSFPFLKPNRPLEPATYTHNGFLRPVSSQLRKLKEHKRSQFKCSYCNKIVENATLLKEHQNQNCFAYIMNNKPSLKLTRVDHIPSIVQKYARAFEEPNNNIPEESEDILHCDEYIDYSQLDQCIVPIPCNQNNPVIFANNENCDVYRCKDNSKETVEIPGLAINKSNSEFSHVPDLSEMEMIRNLFKECKYSPNTISNNNITYLNKNVIKIDNMFKEVRTYKVPIQLEFKPKFCAEFNKKQVTENRSIEDWSDKKIVYIQKPNLLLKTEKQGCNDLANRSITPKATNNSIREQYQLLSKKSTPAIVIPNINSTNSDASRISQRNTSVTSDDNQNSSLLSKSFQRSVSIPQVYKSILPKETVLARSNSTIPTRGNEYHSINSSLNMGAQTAIPSSGYVSQQQQARFNHTEQPHLTAASQQFGVNCQSNAVPFQNYNGSYGTVMVPVTNIPLATPIASVNYVCNVNPVQAIVLNDNSYHLKYNNYMEIVEQRNSSESVVAKKKNIEVPSITSTPAMVNYSIQTQPLANGLNVSNWNSVSCQLTAVNEEATKMNQVSAIQNTPKPISPINNIYDTFLSKANSNCLVSPISNYREVRTSNELNINAQCPYNGKIRVKTTEELS